MSVNFLQQCFLSSKHKCPETFDVLKVTQYLVVALQAEDGTCHSCSEVQKQRRHVTFLKSILEGLVLALSARIQAHQSICVSHASGRS